MTDTHDATEIIIDGDKETINTVTLDEPVTHLDDNNEDVVNADDTNDDEGLPIDRGWAWMVLAGATLYLLIVGSIKKNFGILFVAFLTKYKSSASVTSLLLTVQAIISSVMSLFVMTIGMTYVSHRTSIMVGTVILTVANIITALSTDISILFISFGAMEGIAFSMIHPTVTSILSEYFCKRRGLANGLAFSGASFGGLVFAPAMTALLEYYGYTGTLLIIAGMIFNILITAALLRPIKSFARPKKERPPDPGHLRKETSSDDGTCVGKDIETPGNKTRHEPKLGYGFVDSLKPPTLKLTTYQRSESYHPDDAIKQEDGISPLLPRKRTFSEGHRRKRTLSEMDASNASFKPLHSIVETISKSNVAIFASVDGLCASVMDVRSQVSQDWSNQTETRQSKSCWGRTKTLFRTNFKIIFDLDLLKNPVFILLMTLAALSAPTAGFLSAILVPHAKDIGLSNQDAGILMSVTGACGVVSRLSMAVIVDRKYVRLSTLMGIAFTSVGVLAQFVRFLTTFSTLIAFAVVIGLCCEMYYAMFTVLLVEQLTLSKLKSSVGFGMLCQGVSVSIVFPIVGYLRDATGGYIVPYHYLGTMAILAGFLYLLLSCIHKGNQSKQATSKP